MAVAVTPFAAWLHATAAQAEQTAAQAKAAVAAYEAAFAMTVPPPVIAANRALLMALIATNFFGQNTPAIAATEAQYAEMWAQDAAAMYSYAGASSSASTLTPFSEPPPTTDPAGRANQGAAMAQAAGSTRVHSLSRLTSTLPAALHQIDSSLSSSSASTTQASSILGQLSTLLGGPTELTASTATSINGLVGGLWTVLASGTGWGREIIVSGGIEGYLNLQSLGPLRALSGVSVPSAGVGNAVSVGALSVPPSWATSASDIQPVAFSLSATSIDTAPAFAADIPPGFTFQQALMGTMTGRCAVSEATDRKKTEKDDKDSKGKDEQGETRRSVAELVSAVGWLASSAAYHSRRRPNA